MNTNSINENEYKVIPVLIDDIEISSQNVRTNDPDTGIDELAESIKKHGLLQPVVLKGEIGKPKYDLIVGQRRFCAYKKLAINDSNFAKIPARFIKNIDKYHAIILSLAENVQRIDLNYADKAKAITDLYKHFGKNVKNTSKELGLNENTIREYVKIDEFATDKMKDMMREHKINKADIKRALIAGSWNSGKAEKLLLEFNRQGFTKYEKERAVAYGKNNHNANVNEILKKGQTPGYGETIVLSLTKAISKALEEAGKQLSLGREEIASQAIEDWLKKNGFMK